MRQRRKNHVVVVIGHGDDDDDDTQKAISPRVKESVNNQIKSKNGLRNSGGCCDFFCAMIRIMCTKEVSIEMIKTEIVVLCLIVVPKHTAEKIMNVKS